MLQLIKILLISLLIFHASSAPTDEHENEVEMGCSTENGFTPTDVDINFLMTANKLYLPLASKGSIHFWRERFGMPKLIGGHENDKPCLLTEINMFNAKTSGYDGKSYTQNCYLAGVGKVQCVPEDESISDDEKLKSPGASTATFVLTDNKSYLLSTRCIADKVKDWTLLTVEKNVSADLKKTILDKVRELGFKPENHIEMSYEKC